MKGTLDDIQTVTAMRVATENFTDWMKHSTVYRDHLKLEDLLFMVAAIKDGPDKHHQMTASAIDALAELRIKSEVLFLSMMSAIFMAEMDQLLAELTEDVKPKTKGE